MKKGGEEEEEEEEQKSKKAEAGNGPRGRGAVWEWDSYNNGGAGRGWLGSSRRTAWHGRVSACPSLSCFPCSR